MDPWKETSPVGGGGVEGKIGGGGRGVFPGAAEVAAGGGGGEIAAKAGGGEDAYSTSQLEVVKPLNSLFEICLILLRLNLPGPASALQQGSEGKRRI